MKIPTPYRVMIEKIHKESFQNEIRVRQVRLILSVKFRMGKTNLNSVINEMVELGLIEYIDHESIRVLWKP